MSTAIDGRPRPLFWMYVQGWTSFETFRCRNQGGESEQYCLFGIGAGKQPRPRSVYLERSGRARSDTSSVSNHHAPELAASMALRSHSPTRLESGTDGMDAAKSDTKQR